MTPQPVVPPQDDMPFAPAPTSVAAAFPVGTFLESLVFDAERRLLVTSHTAGEIHHIAADGAASLWATLDTPATGLALDSSGVVFCTGGQPGTAPGVVWRIDGAGAARRWVEIPDATFLNGMTLGPDGRLLAVDSLSGAIHAIRADRPEHGVWFVDERLKPRGPTSVFPGANGIKVRGGAVHVSNTDRAQMLRIDLDAAGAPTGLSVTAERVLVDDFAFGPDGSLYGASHAYNLVVRIAPDGARTAVAGPAEGAVNPTAVAFGVTPDAAGTLYVTTTGGVAAPPPTGPEAARVLKIAVA